MRFSLLITFATLLSAPFAFCQSTGLALSSGSGQPGASVALTLSLANTATGGTPASLQFTLTYDPTDFSSVIVVDSAQTTAAGKAASCNTATAGQNRCLVWGFNASSFGNGSVATVTAVIAPGSTKVSRPIQVTGTLGATVSGSSVPITGSGGTVQVSFPATPTLSSVACSPSSLSSGTSSTCTVALSPAATAATAVSVTSNNAGLAVPSSVTVNSGQSTASFTATAGTITTTSTATVTAFLSGNSRTANIALNASAGPRLISVACSASTLGSGASSPCSVALSAPATSSTIVSLSSNNAGLSVPSSVTVSGGQVTAPFTATAGTLTANSTATVIASLNGTSQTAGIALSAPTGPSLTSVACSPSSLSSGASSSCTVALSSAATTPTTVSVSSNNAGLSVPASATVNSGQSTATFTAKAGTLTTNSTATVTASLSGASRTASIALNAPAGPTLISVACSASSLSSGASSPCSVALSAPATSSMTVSLSSNHAGLTVPSSVTVNSGQVTASFTATTGTLTGNSTATVTASLNGILHTAGIALNGAAPAMTSLSCSPSTLESGATGTCTVTISGGVALNTRVTISDDSSSLTVPSSVTVNAGQSSASLAVTARPVTATATATVTATMGSVSRTASIVVKAPSLTSLSCSPSTLSSNRAATCTVTVSGDTAARTTVAISDNNSRLTVPTSVNIGRGNSSATFTATAGAITTTSAATVTATLDGISRTANITLSPTASPQTISGLVGAYSMQEGSGTAVHDLSANGNNGTILGATWVPGKYGTALSFNGASDFVDLASSAAGSQLTASATVSAWIKSTDPLHGPRLVERIASSSGATPIEWLSGDTWHHIARVYDANAQTTSVYVNGVQSNSALLDILPIPSAIGTRLGGTSFKGAIDEIRVYNRALSADEIQSDMTTALGPTLRLSVTGNPLSVGGDPVTLHVAAADTDGLPVDVAASNLPAGSSFDIRTGDFAWEPVSIPAGSYPLTFTATNASGNSESVETNLDIASGDPVLEKLQHVSEKTTPNACMPHSLASLAGVGLARVDDFTQVLVNEVDAPVVSSTAKTIVFQCPNLAPGSPLTIQARRGTFASNKLDAVMGDPAPAILSISSTNDGTQENNQLDLLITGLGPQTSESLEELQVAVGDAVVPAQSLAAVTPGLWRVSARVPRTAQGAIRIVLIEAAGRRLESNTVDVPEWRTNDGR